MTFFNRRQFVERSSVLLGGVALSSFIQEKSAAASSWLNTRRQADGTASRMAEGVVYHDKNNNGKRDSDEEGIAGVCVSNGREVIKTDGQGRYRLPVDDDTILFVVKPSGWMTPVNALNLPQHFYIHKPNGSPKLKFPGVAPTGPLPASVDFPLRKQKEDNKFRVVLFGDPQPRNQAEIDYMSHDVIEELVGAKAAFGLSLGDEMFDDLSLYDSLNSSIAQVGLPWYNTLGNHDMNYDVPDDTHSTETFQRVYGAPYYAFEYGQVHFLVLENVVWEGEAAHSYHGGLGAKQLDFVRNYLKFVPKDRLVVVAMHIPITGVDDREALYRLLEDRPHTFSLSAHTHVQEHLFLGEKDGWRGKTPHHHLNHATVCGSWWSGAPDERAIPHTTMSDGAPNGYSYIDFDKNKYTVTFKPAHREANFQMHVHAPEKIAAADAAQTEIVVNIFAGSERSRVEMRVGNGAWVTMPQTQREDPYYMAMKELEASEKPPLGRKLPNPTKTPHIWAAMLPAGITPGMHAITVRTTDMFGNEYTTQRLLRVG